MNPTPLYLLDTGHATDVGRVRSENQDAWGCSSPDDAAPQVAHAHIFVVADGMGGHADGRIASQTAVETILATFASPSREGMLRRLQKAFREANLAIFAKVQQLTHGQIMGTTATALVLDEQRVFVAHVGDSRLYRIRKGRAHLLTEDHTMIAAMVRKGILTATEAARHPQRSMLERALGPEPRIEVDVFEADRLRNNDIYVLCSDGLADVTDAELAKIATKQAAQAAADTFIALANERGGMDNTTVQVIKVLQFSGESPDEDASEDEEVRHQSSPDSVSQSRTTAPSTPVHAYRTPVDMRPKWFVPMLSFLAILGISGALWASQTFWAPRGAPHNTLRGESNPATPPVLENATASAPATRSGEQEEEQILRRRHLDSRHSQNHLPSVLETALQSARDQLARGAYDNAITTYEQLQPIYGKEALYVQERERAAQKITALAELQRSEDSQAALNLYEKAYRLQPSPAAESRMTEFRKTLENKH